MLEPDPVPRWARVIRDVGFPIAVALYLLVRLDLLLRENTAALQALTDAVYTLMRR